MEKSKIVIGSIVFVLIFLIFRNWFFSPEIIGGDWPFYHQTIIKSFNFLPPIWSEAHGNGLGGTILAYGIDTYMYMTGSIFTNTIGVPWFIVYKIFWFLLFILLSLFGGFLIFLKITKSQDKIHATIAGLIYSTNTYILMVVGGGQMGIALSYALLPYILVFLLSLFDSISKNSRSWVRNTIYVSIFFSLQALFDPRIAYVSAIVIFFFSLGEVLTYKGNLKLLFNFSLRLFRSIIIIGILTLLLNAFWILPLALVQQVSQTSLGITASVKDVLNYYSFAGFANAFSLLHPNWPENVFGKVAFMRPGFILLPILAFLLLTQKEKNRRILTLFTLGILGAFLAKGSNPPFGVIFEYLFTYVPGFVVFRDPTKFYILVALAYSVLIPYSLVKVIAYFKKIKRLRFAVKTNLPILLFLLLWIILSFPALTGSLSGTFNKNLYINEYGDLSSYIGSQKDFFRTLWVPRQSRLADPTYIHPAVEAQPLFQSTDSAELKAKFDQKNTEKYLSDLGIKYVIIPYDAYGELFLSDRLYSEIEREKYEKMLDSVAWLKKVKDRNITVYEASSSKGLFYSKNVENIPYTRTSSSEYYVSTKLLKSNEFIFSQNYHPLWVAYRSGEKINAEKTKNGLMVFRLPKESNGNIRLVFEGKEIYQKSLVVSLLTLVSLLLLLLVLKLISIKSELKNYEKK